MGPIKEKSEKELMYERFLKAYAEAYPDYLRQTQFKNAQKLWNEVKNDSEKHDEMILDFKKKAKEKEGKQLGKWANWFKKSTAKTTAPKGQKIQKDFFLKFHCPKTEPNLDKILLYSKSQTKSCLMKLGQNFVYYLVCFLGQ